MAALAQSQLTESAQKPGRSRTAPFKGRGFSGLGLWRQQTCLQWLSANYAAEVNPLRLITTSFSRVSKVIPELQVSRPQGYLRPPPPELNACYSNLAIQKTILRVAGRVVWKRGEVCPWVYSYASVTSEINSQPSNADRSQNSRLKKCYLQRQIVLKEFKFTVAADYCLVK